MLLGFALYAYAKPDILTLAAGPVEITVREIVDFHPSEAGRERFDELLWRGGLILTSSSPFFGGLSGLAVEPDGSKLLAISDAGSWLTAALAYRDGRLAGVSHAVIGPLTALKGGPLRRDADRDSEAVALVSGTLGEGEVLIAFEQNRRIGRFPIEKGIPGPPLSYLSLPPAARALAGNKSLEAVAAIATGPNKGFVATFAEHKLDDAGNLMGWLIGPKSVELLRVTAINDFDISDVAAMPDGGLILLERRFRWTEGVHVRIRRVSPEEIGSAKPMTGEVLLQAGPGDAIDNMEGIAVHTDAAGATIITLVSDDNFSLLQRTILLQFAIVGSAQSP